jgi:proline iminopeptidase
MTPGRAIALAVVVALASTATDSGGAATENGSTFPVNGASIYYHAIGSGGAPPLIAVNGGPGFDHNYLHCSTAWDSLAKGRRIVFYDQRGNGRSPVKNGGAMDVAAQVDDLEALRAHLGLERIDLLGHSWGGYLVMAYAARHPEHIDHLIIVDSAAPKWSDTLVLFDDVFPQTMEARAATSSVDAAIRLYFTMLFYSPQKRDGFVAQAGDYHYNLQVNEAVNADLGRLDLTPELAKFKMPTLVMTGRYDLNVAPVIAYRISQAIAGSKFVVFEQSGHMPFYEEPERFVAEVNGFLRR